MPEKFCLKWNDFHTNVSKTFVNLRNEEDFFDVTLVSDDQKQMSAHKVVLSASSEYFKNILRHNKHPNPLLCLEGISSNELNSILDYVYHGEVKIFQEDLNSFLNIADRLKLQGLISTGDQSEEIKEDNVLAQEVKIDATDTNMDKPNNSESALVSSQKTKIVVNTDEFKNVEELDEKILQHLERDVGKKWKCTICNQIMREKTSAKEHVEIHFEGLQFPCSYCNAMLRSRQTFRKHVLRRHKGMKC